MCIFIYIYIYIYIYIEREREREIKALNYINKTSTNMKTENIQKNLIQNMNKVNKKY